MAAASPIIASEALDARLGSDDLRIVDVRWVLGSPGAGRTAFDAGHIPGAIFLDLDSDLVAAEGPGRHPLPTVEAFVARLEAVGIGVEHDVVVYDDAGGATAARLWWMLDDLGHERVRVLDGGLSAWIAAGYELRVDDAESPNAAEPRTAGAPSSAASSSPTDRPPLRDRWTKVIDRDRLAAVLGDAVLLDARAEPRYRGEVEPIDPVAGHIPTARNAPVAGNLGPDGRLLTADALGARFETLGAGARSAGPVISSCGSGVTACFNSLAMRVAGLPDPLLYPGSYSDWSRAGMPIAVGDEPGDAGDPGDAGGRGGDAGGPSAADPGPAVGDDMYGRELAPWFHLLTPPDDYADDAAFALQTLRAAVGGPLETLLELGAGGGNLASHLGGDVRLTLSDLSPAMLALSRTINPGAEHIPGDMRTLRLGRTFDAVLIHDAICYMTTEADLRAAMLTAFEHLRPGGAAIFEPDHIRETFEVGTDHGGEDEALGSPRADAAEGADVPPATSRALRYLEWTTDPDPTDTTYRVDYALLLRDPDGSIRVRHDGRLEGLFPEATWLALLAEVGFAARSITGPDERTFFIGVR